MTRAAPARILGLADRGHLAPGARADIAVYPDLPDPERSFGHPRWVFKDGEPVVEEGVVTRLVPGRTQVVRPAYDPAITRRIGPWLERYHGLRFASLPITDTEMAEGIGSVVEVHPCRGAAGS
jgi:formylmethanofuran dehydrogenase subunit A